MKKQDNIALFESLKLVPEEFSNISIDTLPFSIRVINRFRANGIKTVEELLQWKISDLKSIKGFGAKCHEEIIEYFASYTNDTVDRIAKKDVIREFLHENRNNIFEGDFNFQYSIADREIFDAVNEIKKAYFLLDEELVKQCQNNGDYIVSISNALKAFADTHIKVNDYLNNIRKVDKCRVDNYALPFIEAFSDEPEIREQLLELLVSNNMILKDYIKYLVEENSHNSYAIINTFLRWLSFDTFSEIRQFLEKLKEKIKTYEILSLRANKHTLEMVGTNYGITRERVRQIEKKAVKQFIQWQKSRRILQKIYALRNGDSVLTSVELSEYFVDDYVLLMYLFKNNPVGEVVYDPAIDAFVIGDDSLIEKTQEYVDNLPESFRESDMSGIVEEAIENGLSSELLELTINDAYTHTGDVYHKSRLTLAAIFSDVLKRYYPDGMHIYDNDELDRFKLYVQNDYDIILNQSNRAISSVLGRIGLLCGRGRYRLNDRDFISEQLINNIYDYIDNNEAPIFMTNTLFSIFEDELLEEGIDNKYFLQGLLRNRFDGKWVFRRDYISKDESITSIYASIVGFVKESLFPINKEQIIEKFPGVTEIVINISLSDPEIINLFGVYIHASRLKFDGGEVVYLKNAIDKSISEKSVCHCKEIYSYITADYPSLLKNNFINIPFGLFSVLEYYFRDSYNFERPYISAIGAEIGRTIDVLKNMVADSDIMEISEISLYAKTNYFQINSILDFIDSCNETHLLINSEEIASILLVGADKSICSLIETIIADEIVGTVAITDLKCISRFPKVNVKWSEWLIYSVIKKWGERLEVSTTTKKFKSAIPIISLRGEMDIDFSVKEISKGIVEVDDLSNIEELIGDFLFEDGVLGEL